MTVNKDTKNNIAPNRIKDFTVFVDTNTIHTHEKDIVLFSKSFKEWWEELSKKDDIKLVIPELVYRELAQQKITYSWKEYSQSIKTIKNVNERLGYKNNNSNEINYDQIKEEVENSLFKQVKETKNCNIEPIPYEEISKNDLKNIVQNAIWRKPPFKDNKEGEGFRDSIILETLKFFRSQNPHTDIVFLSNDYVLQNGVGELASKQKNLITFKDTASAKAYIDTAREKFSSEFLSSVISIARNILKDLDQLEFGQYIIKTTIEKFSLTQGKAELDMQSGLSSLAALMPRTYTCEGSPSFHVLDTAFLSVVGNDSFHWSTDMGIFCNYSKISPPTLLGTGGENGKKVRMIMVKLEWEAKVTNDNEFLEFKMISFKPYHDSYKDYDEFYKKEFEVSE